MTDFLGEAVSFIPDTTPAIPVGSTSVSSASEEKVFSLFSEAAYTLFFPLKSAILPPAANAIRTGTHCNQYQTPRRIAGLF